MAYCSVNPFLTILHVLWLLNGNLSAATFYTAKSILLVVKWSSVVMLYHTTCIYYWTSLYKSVDLFFVTINRLWSWMALQDTFLLWVSLYHPENTQFVSFVIRWNSSEFFFAYVSSIFTYSIDVYMLSASCLYQGIFTDSCQAARLLYISIICHQIRSVAAGVAFTNPVQDLRYFESWERWVLNFSLAHGRFECNLDK